MDNELEMILETIAFLKNKEVITIDDIKSIIQLQAYVCELVTRKAA